jgi:hypothetical protein
LGAAARTANAADSEIDSAQTFPVARARFEQNATDGDVEVVFEVTARREGLARLTILAPDGRTVAEFQAPDSSTLGIRQFVFESPEPKDVEGLKSAYPEGEYTFSGVTSSGTTFRGTSRLQHSLPPPTRFVVPEAGSREVPAIGLRISWKPVGDASAYILEIEQEQSPVHLTTKLPASTTSFAVPDGFLRADTEYNLAIGTVARNGNISYVETSFTTADGN